MCDLVLQVVGSIAVAAYIVPYILLPILAAVGHNRGVSLLLRC